MDIRVLGCSGGVGTDLRTTTLLIDHDILIDAGTGVGDLSMAQMAQIRHIFVTHSHLDHITCIPFLVDTLFDQIQEPITIHAEPVTIEALKQYIFNNVIWPDFSRLPNARKPVMRYTAMQPGEQCVIGERRIEMIRVNHVVPGVGYRVENSTGAFAFSGDTSSNDNFWNALNAHSRLHLLIVETAFTNRDVELCRRAGHYCASLLAPDLAKLLHKPKVYITHNKPGVERQIIDECRVAITTHEINSLTGGERFKI
ncbi:MAG: 3',5'-cyclic-nucleotide phosphodiesterase [Gammaproteobacteria bacterium]|nr:3',5'-cyclic-nucleotide phosphodiesterase [Gammaproteobacteria bacterium]